MATKNEQELLDSADQLQREALKLGRDKLRVEEREQENRHERRKRWMLLLLILGIVVGVPAVALQPILQSCNHWNEMEAAQEALQAQQQREEEAAQVQRQRDDQAAMDNAWEKCIVGQGVAGCSLVERRTLQACFFANDSNSTYSCVKKRLREMGAIP